MRKLSSYSILFSETNTRKVEFQGEALFNFIASESSGYKDNQVLELQSYEKGFTFAVGLLEDSSEAHLALDSARGGKKYELGKVTV